MNNFNISSYFVNSQNDLKIEIRIAELCKADYGYYIWPCSFILANYICQNKNSIFDCENSVLLEIGAGTSLPSIIAKKICNFKKVIVTDNLKENSSLLDLIKYSFSLNEIEFDSSLVDFDHGVVIQHFDWTNLDSKILNKMPKINFIIGSDIFFDSKLFEGIFELLLSSFVSETKNLDLVVAIKFLIETNNEKIVFYTSYQIRSFDSYMKLIYLLEKYGLKFEKVEFQDQIGLEQKTNKGFSETNAESHEIIILKIFK